MAPFRPLAAQTRQQELHRPRIVGDIRPFSPVRSVHPHTVRPLSFRAGRNTSPLDQFVTDLLIYLMTTAHLIASPLFL